MYKAVLIIIACSLIHANSYSQKNYKTNIEVFDELITKGLDKFIFYPGLDRNNNFLFVITTNSNDIRNSKYKDDEIKYLTSVIKKKSGAEKLKFSLLYDQNKIPRDSNYNIFILNINNLSTLYKGFIKNEFLGEKTINRVINVNIGVSIRTNDNKLSLDDSITETFHDEVKLDDYENVESTQYLFVQNNPPEINSFESIVFPVLLITVSAAATLLFFIIRTK